MKSIIVTTSWDDGHKLDIELANLLKKYQIKGTFYISPENREFSKNDLLSNKQIIQISKDFEIGAHTMTHPILCNDITISGSRLIRKLLRPDLPKGFRITYGINDTEIKNEIIASKKYLEDLIGKDVVCFSYPDGRNNMQVQNIVRECGFKYARTTESNIFRMPKNLFACGTTLSANRHYQDLYKIARYSGFNIHEFIKYIDWVSLAKSMFDYTIEKGEIYHLWGHSWEINKYNEWERLEEVFHYISGRQGVSYMENKDIINRLDYEK